MFFNPPPANLIELKGEYSFPIVALSIVIACVASYTALAMNERVQKNSFFHHNFWLVLASIAMGFGIWSMHFVGMSAFSLPVDMHYDRLLTVISVFPAMIASFLAFYIANRPKRKFWPYITAGVAILVSFIAFFIFSALQHYMENRFIRLMTAITMGLAVSSMHYTGMMAISFYVSPDHSHMTTVAHEMKMTFIVIGVTFSMFLLLSLLSLSSVVDRYVKYRTNYFDALTRLPNRRQFERKLANSSAKQTLAIWHLHDLEKVNRENGYLFGDEVLQHVADLMIALKPPLTELYRIEGNRFAFLTRGVEGETNFHAAMENRTNTSSATRISK